MVSLLFAGIKIPSLITRYRCQKLLTQEVIFSVENRPVFDRNAGRLHVGIRNRRSAINGYRIRFGVLHTLPRQHQPSPEEYRFRSIQLQPQFERLR